METKNSREDNQQENNVGGGMDAPSPGVRRRGRVQDDNWTHWHQRYPVVRPEGPGRSPVGLGTDEDLTRYGVPQAGTITAQLRSERTPLVWVLWSTSWTVCHPGVA